MRIGLNRLQEVGPWNHVTEGVENLKCIQENGNFWVVRHPLLSRPCSMTYFATRGFRHSAPAVWNSLPRTVLDSLSLSLTVFKSRLKTHLFYLANTWLTLGPILDPLCHRLWSYDLRRYRNVFIIIAIIIIIIKHSGQCCGTLRSEKITATAGLRAASYRVLHHHHHMNMNMMMMMIIQTSRCQITLSPVKNLPLCDAIYRQNTLTICFNFYAVILVDCGWSELADYSMRRHLAQEPVDKSLAYGFTRWSVSFRGY